MNAPISKKQIAKVREASLPDRSPERVASLLRVMDRMSDEAGRKGLTPRKLKRILAEIKAERRLAGD